MNGGNGLEPTGGRNLIRRPTATRAAFEIDAVANNAKTPPAERGGNKRTKPARKRFPCRFVFGQLYLGIHKAGGAFGATDCWNEGPAICGAKEWILAAGGLAAGAGGFLIGGTCGTGGLGGGGVP